MQFFSILVLLLLQNSLFACAAQRGSKPEENKPPDDPNIFGENGGGNRATHLVRSLTKRYTAIGHF